MKPFVRIYLHIIISFLIGTIIEQQLCAFTGRKINCRLTVLACRIWPWSAMASHWKQTRNSALSLLSQLHQQNSNSIQSDTAIRLKDVSRTTQSMWMHLHIHTHTFPHAHERSCLSSTTLGHSPFYLFIILDHRIIVVQLLPMQLSSASSSLQYLSSTLAQLLRNGMRLVFL